jgi:hypothetical protein
MTEWFATSGYHGCPFINAGAEAAASDAVQEVRGHPTWLRGCSPAWHEKPALRMSKGATQEPRSLSGLPEQAGHEFAAAVNTDLVEHADPAFGIVTP